MTDDKLDRRKFLKVSSTGVASILVACSQKTSSDDSMMNPDASSPEQIVPTDGAVNDGRDMNNTADAGGQTDVGQDAATTDAETVQNCDRTSAISPVLLAEGIPVRSDFDLYGDPGEHLPHGTYTRPKLYAHQQCCHRNVACRSNNRRRTRLNQCGYG